MHTNTHTHIHIRCSSLASKQMCHQRNKDTSRCAIHYSWKYKCCEFSVIRMNFVKTHASLEQYFVSDDSAKTVFHINAPFRKLSTPSIELNAYDEVKLMSSHSKNWLASASQSVNEHKHTHTHWAWHKLCKCRFSNE